MSAKRNQGKSRWGLFVLVNTVILFFLVIGFGREYVGNIQIENEIKDRENERAELLDEQTDTLLLIDQLSSEYYLEKEARLKHGLGREGETMILVQEGSGSSAYGEVVNEEGVDLEEEIANPEKWFYYFFDKSAFDDLNTL